MTILGWHKNLPMAEFHELVFAKPPMPGWERAPSGELFAAQYDWVAGSKSPRAYDLAVEFDDVSDGHFHWSEWLDDGHPLAHKGDVIHARFEFQFERDRDFFVEKFNGRATETDLLRFMR